MLDIIPALLLVTGTVFLVLLILLNKTLYKPLLEFIDNRNNSINRDLENAGKNAGDSHSFVWQYYFVHRKVPEAERLCPANAHRVLFPHRF